MELPITISNINGEELTFERYEMRNGVQCIVGHNILTPKAGPPMHVHFKQDESLTVIEGLMGYQTLGGEAKYAKVGETATFLAGTPHKFWNASDTELLKCAAWVSPADNIIYFLREIYRSTNENKGRPGLFDTAYLMSRYKSEFDMLEIPSFVKKFIFPVVIFLGKLSGKHKKYADAPEPI